MPAKVRRICLRGSGSNGPVVVEATGEVFGDAPNVAGACRRPPEPGTVLVTLNIQRQVAGLFVAEEQGVASSRACLGISSSSGSFAPAAAVDGAARER